MPGKVYRIGELASLAGVTRRTVHYYINKGLIPPAEGAGVSSYYTEDHLNLIMLIRKLQESYLPLDEIRKIVAPLKPNLVMDYLNQYKHSKPVIKEQPVELFIRETAQPEKDSLPGTLTLYERVDLGGKIELHFPAELREKTPALVRALIENTRKIIDNH